jgi:hypothetical protein
VSAVERRFTPGQVEVRAGKDSRSVGGYALKFNKQSRNLGGFLDIPLRTLNSIKLVDVAPVNAPAYMDTSTAVRSLAVHMHADEAEVRKLAESNDLRKFFKRTDAGAAAKHTTFGPSARMALLGRSTDPYV